MPNTSRIQFRVVNFRGNFFSRDFYRENNYK